MTLTPPLRIRDDPTTESRILLDLERAAAHESVTYDTGTGWQRFASTLGLDSAQRRASSVPPALHTATPARGRWVVIVAALGTLLLLGWCSKELSVSNGFHSTPGSHDLD